MAATQFSGFRHAGNANMPGACPIIRSFKFSDTESLIKGDLLNLETSEIDLAAQGDTALIGIANETKSGTDSTTDMEVIEVNEDTILEKYDANARTIGTVLRLGTGGSGAQNFAAATLGTNEQFIVIEDSTATEVTRVRVAPRALALYIA